MKHYQLNLLFVIHLIFILLLFTIAVAKKINDIPNETQRGHSKEDSEAFNSYNRLLNNMFPYGSTVMEAGIEVDSVKVEKRIALYKQLYPNIKINRFKIKIQLKIEKYFEQKGELNVDTLEIIQAYNKLSSMKKEKLPKLENMKEALKAEIFFNSEDYLTKMKEHSELKYIKSQERRSTVKSEKDLILKGPPDACVVKNKTDGTCFITIKEFNGRVHLNTTYYSKEMEVDDVRNSILKRYIDDKLIAQKARQDAFDVNSDSLVNRMKKNMKMDKIQKKIKAFGRPVKNIRKLRAIYDRYYDELFKPYSMATIQIIGSSDSLYVDSLYQQCVLGDKEKKTKKQKVGTKDTEPNLPWRSIQEDKLPYVLVAPTMKFDVGQFSKPIISEFGFFISKVKEFKFIPEISFDSALVHCQYIATREKYLKLDSLIEAKSQAYYLKNKDKFLTPDTLELKVWLAPDSIKKDQNIQERTGKDTTRYAPIHVSSLNLPHNTLTKLEAAVKREKNKETDFYGPVNDIFGCWYFKIISSKVGKRQIPFYVVKQDIINEIAKPKLKIERVDKDRVISEQLKNEILLTIGTRKAYVSQKFNEVMSLPDSEILSGAGSEIKADPAISINREKRAIAYGREKLKKEIISENYNYITSHKQNFEIATDILHQ